MLIPNHIHEDKFKLNYAQYNEHFLSLLFCTHKSNNGKIKVAMTRTESGANDVKN